MSFKHAAAIGTLLLTSSSAVAQASWVTNDNVGPGGGYEIIAATKPGIFEYQYQCGSEQGHGTITVTDDHSIIQNGPRLTGLNYLDRPQLGAGGYKIVANSGGGNCIVRTRPMARPVGLRFGFSQVHVDNGVGPRSIGDTIYECLGDKYCNLGAKTAAQKVGIAPDDVDAAFEMVRSIKTSITRQSAEDTDMAFSAPAEMSICRVRVMPTSVIPASGDNAPIFAIRIENNEVKMHTFTRRQGPGGGQSSWEGDIFVTYVNSSSLNQAGGLCTVRSVVGGNCKGTSGGDNFPGCRIMDF